MKVYKDKRSKTWRVKFTVEGQAYDLPLETKILELAHQKARKLFREKKRGSSSI